jgi:hypothetical protein
MKLSRTKQTAPAFAAALQVVDDEIAKIVADISAHRSLKPARSPGSPPPKGGQHRRARAA